MFTNIRNFSHHKSPMLILETAKKMDAWTYRLSIPGMKACIVGHHEVTREIFLDKLTDKPRLIYKNLEGTKTKTMFTSANSDPYMKAVRKTTAHAFSSREVGRMNDVATKYVNEWLNGRLANLVERQEAFDPAVEFNRITFKVICESAFEYIATDDEFDFFEHHSMWDLTEHALRQSNNPFRKACWFLFPEARKGRQSSDALLEFSGRVLEAYRQKPLSERSTNNTLIKILHDNPAIETEHQRRSEIKDWLVAGHDTTGYSLANMTVLVAKHPQVQDKLRKEIAKSSSTDDCEYFKKVTKETLRVMPTAAGGSVRITGRDFQVKETGEIIPKGTVTFHNQYLMNHNPSVYGPDADKFIPERWDHPTEEMKAAIMPFAVGTRNCPGQSLAMAEINNTFPRLLSKYHLEVVDEGYKTYFLTLKFKGSKILATKL
jgi:cytochrome P450